MLTALTIKDYNKDNKRHIFFKRDKTHLEVVKYNNIQIVHIIYSKYGKNVKWEKIRELAGNESRNILCNKNIIFPQDSGLKRYTTNLLKERIAENTAIEVLKKCKAPTEDIEIGLYDPNGRKTELVESLLRYTGRLTVVTDATGEYYKVYKQVIRNTGAVLLLKKDVSALKGCNMVVAPQKIRELLPVGDETVIFTAEKPAVCQNGRVYSRYIVALNESYKEIKPHSLSDEYFAQALYDKGRQHRLGSVLPILCISEGLNSTIDEISDFLSKKLLAQKV
ncbi:MAG: hypothetical protein U0M12_01005 [Acutalibacteraceae bacterium]|nr:hypothetical protein [Acutalibacteraceae bacterium]